MHQEASRGFYPILTDDFKTIDSFWSCRLTLRRIRGLWKAQYSRTGPLELSKEPLARCIISAVMDEVPMCSARLTVTERTVFVGL